MSNTCVDSAPTTERSRVLFVDDEPLVRAAFSRLMASAQIQADVAESGAEAIALAHAHSYAVVVSDVCLPGISGPALIQQLRVLHPTALYAAITGFQRLDPEYEQVLQEEDLTLLRKPWCDEELLELVRSGLEATPSSERRLHSRSSIPLLDLRVLVLEDSPSDAELCSYYLHQAMSGRCHVKVAGTLQEAIEFVRGSGFDVVIVDLSVPDAHGLDAVFALRNAAPSLPLVVLTGTDDDQLGLQAVQSGAQDYLIKDQTDPNLLKRSIHYSIERKRSEQRLLRMAHYDQLTGLANRSLFRQRIANALARARRTPRAFAVMLLDLDEFKPVNDELGHEAGDVLLQKVATALSRVVAEGDTVARVGGDEFAVLLEARDGQMAVASIAQRLLDAVAVRHDVGVAEVFVTASTGVAVFPEAGDSVDGLLKAADESMYAAKDLGRNRFCIGHAAPRTGDAPSRRDPSTS